MSAVSAGQGLRGCTANLDLDSDAEGGAVR